MTTASDILDPKLNLSKGVVRCILLSPKPVRYFVKRYFQGTMCTIRTRLYTADGTKVSRYFSVLVVVSYCIVQWIYEHVTFVDKSELDHAYNEICWL